MRRSRPRPSRRRPALRALSVRPLSPPGRAAYASVAASSWRHAEPRPSGGSPGRRRTPSMPGRPRRSDAAAACFDCARPAACAAGCPARTGSAEWVLHLSAVPVPERRAVNRSRRRPLVRDTARQCHGSASRGKRRAWGRCAAATSSTASRWRTHFLGFALAVGDKRRPPRARWNRHSRTIRPVGARRLHRRAVA